MAKKVVIKKAGGVHCVTTVPMDIPEPSAGEVRVKVAYAGINFADLLMRMGFYQPRPPFPFTPGYEVSGVIDALGEGVEELKVGQRVVERQHIDGRLGGDGHDVVQGLARLAAPAFGRPVLPRRIDEDPTHRAGGGLEELNAVQPLHVGAE